MSKICLNCGQRLFDEYEKCPECESVMHPAVLKSMLSEESINKKKFSKYKYLVIATFLTMIIIAGAIRQSDNRYSEVKQKNEYFNALENNNLEYLVENTKIKGGKKTEKKDLIAYSDYYSKNQDAFSNFKDVTLTKESDFSRFTVSGLKGFFSKKYILELTPKDIYGISNQTDVVFNVEGKEVGKTKEAEDKVKLGSFIPGDYKFSTSFKVSDKEFVQEKIFNIMDEEQSNFRSDYYFFGAEVTTNIDSGEIFVGNQKVSEISEGYAKIESTLISELDSPLIIKGYLNQRPFIYTLPVDYDQYQVDISKPVFEELNINLPISRLIVDTNLVGGILSMNNIEIGEITESTQIFEDIIFDNINNYFVIEKKFNDGSVIAETNYDEVIPGQDVSINIESSEIQTEEQIREFVSAAVTQNILMEVRQEYLSSSVFDSFHDSIKEEGGNLRVDLMKSDKTEDIQSTTLEFIDFQQTGINSYDIQVKYHYNIVETQNIETTSFFRTDYEELIISERKVDGKFINWKAINEDGYLKIMSISE